MDLVAERGPANVARLLKGRLLRGGNAHYRASVFVQPVDLGALTGLRALDAGAHFLPEFAARFGDLDSTTRRLAPTVPLTEALLEAILAVERFVARGMSRPDAPANAGVAARGCVAHFFWESYAAWISRAAARTAFAGVTELLPVHLRGDVIRGPSFMALIAQLRRKVRRRQWSNATAALITAANERGLPHEMLAGNYVRIGEGAMQHVLADAARLDQIFGNGPSARIPTALIIGQRGTGAVAREVDRLLRNSREGVGLATRSRTTIDGRVVDRTSLARSNRPEFLLGDPRVRTLVSAVTTRAIARRGLGFERSSVTALLHPDATRDPVEYRLGLEVSVRATLDAIVVGADNPHVQLVLDSTGPASVILVASQRRHPVALRHASAGGVVVQATRRRGTLIEFRRGTATIAFGVVAPSTHGGTTHLRRRLTKALYSAAVAFALGAPLSRSANASGAVSRDVRDA